MTFDRLQMEEFLAHHRQIVKRTISRRFPERDQDEDLFQVGMIGLWEAAIQWDGVTPFPPFARQVVYRDMVDYVRAQNRVSSREEPEEEQISPDAAPQIDSTVDIDRRISGQFPKGSREALVLSWLAAGRTKKEIAAVLGVTPARVGQIARRAAEKIRLEELQK